MSYPKRTLLLFICVAALFGVAYLTSLTTGNTEDALREQIAAEWEAKVNQNFGAVYDMTANAYKKMVKRDKFLQRGHISVKEYSVKELKIADSGKEARAVIEFITSQMGFEFTFKSKETWIWEDGAWRLNISPVPLTLPGMSGRSG